MSNTPKVDLSRFSLEGKVALVTGGSRGIGEATAIGFALAGADVAVTSRKLPDLERVAAKVEETGRSSLPLAAHLGKMENLPEVVRQVKEKFGRLDILVNNAGTSPANASVLDAEERLWDTVINLNLKGLYFLSQHAARLMKETGGGSIINVSSENGLAPTMNRGIYAISKAGVIMATKSMALDLAQYNIRVNAIAPGAIDTKLLNSNWANLADDQANEVRKRVAEHIPLNHIGDPDEIAGAMIYLASDSASFMTGETMLIDGGQMLV